MLKALFFTLCPLFISTVSWSAIEPYWFQGQYSLFETDREEGRQILEEMRIAGFKNVELIHLPELPAVLPPTHLASFNVLVLRQTPWNRNTLLQWLTEVGAIYSQCGVQFRNIDIVFADTPSGRVDYTYDVTGGEDDFIHLHSINPLKRTGKSTAYFINQFSGHEDKCGISFADWTNRVGRQPEIYNTVFLSSYCLTEKYLREISHGTMQAPYNTVAHEFLHVLTREGQHYNDNNPRHLLNIWKTRTNHITPRECTDILKNSELVRAL